MKKQLPYRSNPGSSAKAAGLAERLRGTDLSEVDCLARAWQPRRQIDRDGLIEVVRLLLATRTPLERHAVALVRFGGRTIAAAAETAGVMPAVVKDAIPSAQVRRGVIEQRVRLNAVMDGGT